MTNISIILITLKLLFRYDGVCDKDGCDWAAFRLGDEEFYGPGKTIDTNSRITVVTQWITDDGTANGNLKAVRRKWIQNGKVIDNTHVMILHHMFG